jgi:hypothetical protein
MFAEEVARALDVLAEVIVKLQFVAAELQKRNGPKQSASANMLHRKKHDRSYDCEAC